MSVISHFPPQIKVVEVGPRDGLQNMPTILPPQIRATMVDKLADAGLNHIEVGSFVSPAKVPAMVGSEDVFKIINRKKKVIYSALTPNLKGFERAVAANVSEVAVFASASEGFSQKNINCSISESLKRFEPIIEAAQARSIRVRGYISCVLGCPYDGSINPSQVALLCQDMMHMGCYEISLGDTIGVGTPVKAKALFSKVAQLVPITSVAAHFHNTYGQALANLYAVIEEGVSIIDSAIAGLGGCPYAPGASGNVATEDVVYMLDGIGIESGVDIEKLVAASLYICEHLGISSSSNAGIALSSIQ